MCLNNFTGNVSGEFPAVQLQNVNTRLFLAFLLSLFFFFSLARNIFLPYEFIYVFT